MDDLSAYSRRRHLTRVSKLVYCFRVHLDNEIPREAGYFLPLRSRLQMVCDDVTTMKTAGQMGGRSAAWDQTDRHHRREPLLLSTVSYIRTSGEVVGN